MEEKIVLDKHSFKALAADSRVKILKILGKRRHTQSELAADLNLSIPTVKEHLKAMEKAGLVSMMDEGRKWKYYELTRKAKVSLDPEMKKIWILLSIIGLMVVGGLTGVMKQAFDPMYGFGSMEAQSFNDLAKTTGDMPDISAETAPSRLGEEAAKSASAGATSTVDMDIETVPAVEAVEPEAIEEAAAVESEEDYTLPRPDLTGFQFNTGVKIYLGILGALLLLTGYFAIIRHRRLH